MKRTRPYFAFGSNLDVKQMHDRCPRSQPGSVATAPGWRLAFRGWSAYRQGGVATIDRDQASEVQGRLYRVDDPLDLMCLDRAEGRGRVYEVEVIDVLVKGKRVRAWTYRLKSDRCAPPLSAPGTEYLNQIEQAYLDLGLETVPLYQAVEAAVEAAVDAQDETGLAGEDDQGGGDVPVFVYGTLRRGQPNHGLLKRCADTVQEATTEFGFAMYDLGAFPAIVRDPGGGPVTGEVYLVDPATLAALDRLEGHPRHYRRDVVRLDDGSSAMAYLYPKAPVSGRLIPSGDWTKRPERDRSLATSFPW